MFKLLVVMLSLVATASLVAAPSSADLPTRKYLNLAAIKTMVAAAEAEAKKQNVEVTICIVDESGNLLFLQKADAASLNTIQFAQRKARHAAFYRAPSKNGADAMKKGDVEVLAFPDFFPNQGGLPIQLDGQPLGGIAAAFRNIPYGIQQPVVVFRLTLRFASETQCGAQDDKRISLDSAKCTVVPVPCDRIVNRALLLPGRLPLAALRRIFPLKSTTQNLGH
jgi:glc operon protein GlcG